MDADGAAGPPYRVTTDVERRRRVDDVLARIVPSELGLSYQRAEEGAFLLTLPGSPRDVPVWIVAGDHGVLVEAFFLRRPEDSREAVLEMLLARNGRSYGVHFALDAIGDVYLTGQLPFDAILGRNATTELDRVLGQVLAHVEEAYPAAVEVAFAGALAREKMFADGAGRRACGTVLRAPVYDTRR